MAHEQIDSGSDLFNYSASGWFSGAAALKASSARQAVLERMNVARAKPLSELGELATAVMVDCRAG
jgi:hypothetical protein